MHTHVDRHELLTHVLRDLRTQANLTQTEVATRLGKPQSYVSKYEGGERRLDLIELVDLCQALGTDLSNLVEIFEERQR
jgi:transcriptional regulator with XRE-family HTH domain